MVTRKAETTQNDKAVNVYAAVGVGFVCLVVGLPLWWKTTEVYRVSLPYSDMQALAEAQLGYMVNLEVISFEERISTADLATLSKHLMDTLDLKKWPEVKSQYRLSVRERTEQEVSLLKSAQTISDLDDKLRDHFKSSPNFYQVIVLPHDSHIQVTRPVIGRHQNVFCTKSYSDWSRFSEQLADVIRNTLVRENSVNKAFTKATGARSLKADKESMRSVKSHTGYDITLTLVCPQPDVMDVQWDVEQAVTAYLDPLRERLAPYTSVNIKSQVLYFTQLLTKPKRDWQQDNVTYYFTESELPHMINPLEAKLGSPASTSPELNLLVYVPTPDQYPLYIRNGDGENLPSNSFLSPQWGGIFIYNIAPPQGETTPVPSRPSLDMRRVMEVFLTQIRLLLNLHSQESRDVDQLQVGNLAVTTWEVEGWLRTRCIENLATASATLNSLAQLLGKISNIVINDDIGQEVSTAVEKVKESRKLLAEGLLTEAFLASRDAIVASEKAFFDPSLLELLYFPEDQKFAIYIPLFLPISFPVIASLWQSWQWYRGLKKLKEE